MRVTKSEILPSPRTLIGFCIFPLGWEASLQNTGLEIESTTLSGVNERAKGVDWDCGGSSFFSSSGVGQIGEPATFQTMGDNVQKLRRLKPCKTYLEFRICKQAQPKAFCRPPVSWLRRPWSLYLPRVRRTGENSWSIFKSENWKYAEKLQIP